jgi:protein tyrosine/serine phosphatase
MTRIRKLFRPGPLAVLAAVVLIVFAVVFYFRAYRLRYFGEIEPGRVYRCRQPRGLQWGALERYGIERVISLRTYATEPEMLEQERAECAEAGAEFVHIPISELVPSEEKFVEILRSIRTSPGPVLLHCQHGRDRTGMTFAAYRVLMHEWSIDRAIEEEMVEYEADLTPEKRRKMEDILRRIQANRAEWMERTSGEAPGEQATTRPAA